MTERPFWLRRARVVAPGGRTRWHRDAGSALELPAGTLAATGTLAGDMIEYHEEDSR